MTYTREEAVEIAMTRDGGCVCRTWSSYPCVGPLDPDEPRRRSQGADICDPEQIQILCRAHHNLKDQVMRKGAKILGLNGREAQEFEKFQFHYETPKGDWPTYLESWLRSWNSEYAYMIGKAEKPASRYKPE